METVTDFISLGSRITVDSDCSFEVKRCLPLGRKVMTNLDGILKSRYITLLTKSHTVKAIVFPVVMYGCESWTIKKAEHQRLMFLNCGWRRLLRVLWNTRTVNPKGNQPWIFIGRTDAEAAIPVICPPDAKSQLIRKDPNAGKDWKWEEKGMVEDEMVKWHYWLDGHEFKQTPGYGEGQGSLTCCSPWGRKELDKTEWLSNNKYLQSKFQKWTLSVHTALSNCVSY